MAYDPIPLQGKQYDPMSSYAKAMQLKALAQEAQQREQELQLTKMRLADMAQQVSDKKAVRDAYSSSIQPQQATVVSPGMTLGGMVQAPEPDQRLRLSDMGTFQDPAGPYFAPRNQQIQGPNAVNPQQMLATLGQSAPHLVPGIQAQMDQAAAEKQKQALEAQKTQAEIAKTLAQTDSTTIETHIKKFDGLGQIMSGLYALPTEQRAAAYPYYRNLAIQNKFIDEAHAPTQYPGDEQLMGWMQQGMSAKDTLQAELDKRKQTETERHNKQDELNTVRGQNMVDARARDANKAMIGVSYSQLTPDMQRLVDEMGTGKMAMGNLERIAMKNPGLLGAVAEKYPDFDQSKIKSYTQAYRDFTGAGKYGQQLQSGSVALRHLAQLRDINDKNPTTVRIPGTAAHKAYENLLDTVAAELLTFYGTPKTNETIKSVKDTLGGLTNRDAAINEQALAMGQKFDELEQTWENAKPSSSYQSPMPGYSAEAKAARAKLDPEYAARTQQGGGNGMTRIQASDGSMHDIPTANLNAARQRDPGLKVVQ